MKVFCLTLGRVLVVPVIRAMPNMSSLGNFNLGHSNRKYLEQFQPHDSSLKTL